MKPIGSYVEICRALTRRRFVEEYAHPFLLQNWGGARLRPHDDVQGNTLNPLLMLDHPSRKAARNAPSKKEHSWLVFPVVAQNPEATRINIGFSELCDVQINDESLSHVHAFVEKKGSNYLLHDADSASGTTVNAKAVERDHPRKLTDGDSIALGFIELMFLLPKSFHVFMCRYFQLGADGG